MNSSKFFKYPFLISVFVISVSISAYCGLFEKTVKLHMPNHSTVRVRVDLLTDKVTKIRDQYGWVELSDKTQKMYQHIYDLQKDRKKNKKKKQG